MDRAGLEGLPFFAGLPPLALDLLAEAAREQEVAAGKAVLHQHDRVRTVHFLVDGALQILVRVGDARELLLAAAVQAPAEQRA